jgi:transcriptional regulator with PAS, ATPase and Fis domain
MNAHHAAPDLLDRQHHTTWAPAMVSGQSTTRRPVASGDGPLVDAPLGTSQAWRDVIKRATHVAVTEATTCLQGESGTGKEVIARLIHHRSPRSRGPFIAINCAGLPEQLLESELFGFERGAFTGAQQSKPGQRSSPLADALQDQEKEMIETALAKSQGKVAGPRGAAARLGIPPSTLESKIKQLKIEKSRFANVPR